MIFSACRQMNKGVFSLNGDYGFPKLSNFSVFQFGLGVSA